jgi:hypothetical protein
VQVVAEKLSRAGVNVEYAYGSGDGEKGLVFFRVSDTVKAHEALGD